MSNICSFKRYFKEPEEDYVCFSTSLFFKDKYIKMKKNYTFKDETMIKVESFVKNIINTIRLFLKKKTPKNYYYRIYFDKSLNKIKEYKNLLEILRKLEKVQLIEFECNDFKNKNNKNNLSHLELFGTFMRFHAMFDKESPNLKTVISIDADNSYKEKFIDIVEKFIKSKNIVSCILPISTAGMHNNDFQKLDFFNYIYFIANGVLIKKDPEVFSYQVWDKYFNHMFEQEDLMYVFNYIDFKRLAISSVLETKVPISEKKSYYGFYYGADEIWLNFVLKKIIKDNNKEDLLVPYFTKNYNIKFVIGRFLDYLRYNKKINKTNFDYFISENEYKSIDIMEKILKKKNFNPFVFLKKIKKNKFLDRIYIQSGIKYIILNFDFLVSKTKGQYSTFEIM
tara:strand:+ start:3323 stop:4507 length:1185 start_codon:yes stop_codon:yes gene_type:complete